ncbi:DHH family phosphoesterase [Candidatus Micrarchaeota archaeon]|nr:DHH family phosphoesterase [Candidatus Micrarchaeota archaeon]
MASASEFQDFLLKHRESRIAIVMHRNADLDALSSAYALNSIFPNSIIAAPDEMNKPSRDFAKETGITVNQLGKLKKEQFDGLIVVDAATYVMVEEARGWNVLCIIDHHHAPPEAERISADLEICVPDSPSTAQLVSSLIPDPSPSVAFALAIGIISDTARFKGGNIQSFEEIARLLKISGKSYSEALAIAEPELAPDEKMFILSCFQKCNVVAYKNFVIATTIVHASESDSSSSLSEFADIAFAASYRAHEQETRVSARARKHVPIKLNEVMREVGERFFASGGGHPKAAGANAKARPEEVLEYCVEAVKDALDSV